jgi:hypothetical protein
MQADVIELVENTGCVASRYSVYLKNGNIPITGGSGITVEDAILDLANTIKRSIQDRIKEIVFGKDIERALASMGSNGYAVIDPSPGARIEHIGKIVWYTPGGDDVFSENSGVLPAIITRQWIGLIMDVNIFSAGGNHTRHSIEYSETPKPGTWRWPEAKKN